MNRDAERKRLDKAGGEFWTKLTAAGGHMSKHEAHKAAEDAGYKNGQRAVASHQRHDWLKKDGDGYSFTEKANRAMGRHYAAHRAEKNKKG